MAWIDISAPDGGTTWDRSQSIYYEGKVYVPDATVLRIYDVSNNTWTSKAFPSTIGSRGAICIDFVNGDLFIAGNSNFFKYHVSTDTFSALSHTTAFFTGFTSSIKRIYYYRNNLILGVHCGNAGIFLYSISANTWSTPGNTLNYDVFGYAGMSLSDERYPKWKGWHVCFSGTPTLRFYRGIDNSGESATQVGVVGALGPNIMYTPTTIYIGGNSALSSYSANVESGSFTTVSSDFGDQNGPACWGEGFVFHWTSNGSVGKKWTPTYKVAGTASYEGTIYAGVKIVVLKQGLGEVLGMTYTNAYGNWIVGLETNDPVDIIAYNNGAADAFANIVPVAY